MATNREGTLSSA